MAVAWPDPESAVLGDWEPIEAILMAIDERRAVAAEVNDTEAGTVGEMCWPGVISRGTPPTREALEWIRDAICSLAAVYVFPDDDAYRASGFASFPERATSLGTRYGQYFPADADRPLQGDHSIADPPLSGSSELKPSTLRRYRDWLANCYWWLERIRFLDASHLCRYKRKATMKEERRYSLYESYNTDGTLDKKIEDGEPILADLAEAELDIEEDEDGYPASSVCSLKISGYRQEWYDSYGEDIYLMEVDEGHVFSDGTWYSGMSAINPAGLSARLLVMPFRPRSGRNVYYSCERAEIEEWFPLGPNYEQVPGFSTFMWAVQQYAIRHSGQVFTYGSYRTLTEEEYRYILRRPLTGGGRQYDHYVRDHAESFFGWPPDNPEDATVTRRGDVAEVTGRDFDPHPGKRHSIQHPTNSGREAASYDGFQDGFILGVPFYIDTLDPMSECEFSDHEKLKPRHSFPLPDEWVEFLERCAGIEESSYPSKNIESIYLDIRRALSPVFDYGPFFEYGRSSA